jgi:iron complex transport system substrate-binding protein
MKSHRRFAFLYVAVVLFFSTSIAQIRVVDDLQRSVTLPSRATRIVSLAPSITETLFAIGAGEHVVGVTDYCNFPSEAKSKQKVGGMTNPSIETIVRLKPDLIAMSMEGNTKQGYDNLVRFKIPVFVSNPRTLEGIYQSIEQLGALTGRTESARQLSSMLKLRSDSLAATTKKVKTKSVLFFVSLQPAIVVGKGTFLHQLIELAGGVNAASKTQGTYPQYSREAVLKDNPDVLIFLQDVLRNRSELTTLYPEWKTLKAFHGNRIFTIDADIVSRPGPRAVQGLAQLIRLVHQEK